MDKKVETLACFVHGALAFGHLLGALYNLQRNNRKTVIFHVSAAVFDCIATYEHSKERRHHVRLP